MIPENAVDAREPYILIEGPRWGDAEFYGDWFLAAARADRLCKAAIKNDAKFSKQIELLQECRHPLDFDKCASAVFLALEEHRVTTLFPVASARAEAVAMMAEMGFFMLTGSRYQMVLPTRLDIGRVKAALLQFAQTADEDCVFHADHLLTTMPLIEAKTCQARLGAMDQNDRIAHRRILLDAACRVTGPRSNSGWASAPPSTG
jgi:hypothetical protein